MYVFLTCAINNRKLSVKPALKPYKLDTCTWTNTSLLKLCYPKYNEIQNLRKQEIMKATKKEGILKIIPFYAYR